jgi:hypothetical protein
MVHTGTQANASSFKKQPLSTSRSSPGFSIGRSTREDWKRVGFLGVAKTADSGSSPQFSCLGLKGGAADFGASVRQLPPFKGIDAGFDSPGPAAYPEKYGMGPGSLSMAPSASMGAGKRNTLATNMGLDSPGPVYDPKDLDSIGNPMSKNAGGTFCVGPSHCPPGLNLSPFKHYEHQEEEEVEEEKE